MASGQPSVNYWALSFHRLALYCRDIADTDSPSIPPALRAEAARMLTAWQEGLALPEDGFDQAPRRANMLAALRKRTIEILLKVDNLR